MANYSNIIVKTFGKVMLDSDSFTGKPIYVDLVEGQRVPQDIYRKYRQVLVEIGAIDTDSQDAGTKDVAEVEQAAAKKSTSKKSTTKRGK